MINRYVYCHDAKWVQVGDHKVYVCSYSDLDTKTLEEIAQLDIFISLDNNFYKLTKYEQNPLVEKISLEIRKPSRGLTNILMAEIKDMAINLKTADAILKLVKENYKVGFGCLAGHGRTGYILGYLIKHLENLKGNSLLEAIHKRFCENCLESKAQHNQLGINYTPLFTRYTINGACGKCKKNASECWNCSMLLHKWSS